MNGISIYTRILSETLVRLYTLAGQVKKAMVPPWTHDVEEAMADAEEEDVEEPLDCGICFLPLEAPPIFMCEAGHLICSPCRDMLGLAVGTCHVCSAKAARLGSRRNLGRDVWPLYYETRDRSGALRGPCRCPGDACGFVDSTAALLYHFVSAHDWPVHAGVSSGDSIAVRLQDGFNIVAVDCIGGASEQDRLEFPGRYLLVLEMIQQTFGRTVFAFCLRPGAAFWEKEAQCRLSLSYSRNILDGDDDKPPVQCYYQTTKAGVTCTDLSSGLPDPEDCFQAHVFRSADLEDNEDTVEVTLRIIIN
ncbi:hypothetical protein VPH35_007420 [Triticum aestivum]